MVRRPAEGLDPALRKRISAGASLAVVAIGDVLLGGWFFAALLLVAVVVMASEWARLAGNPDPAVRRLVLWPSILIPAGAIVLGMNDAMPAALMLLGAGCAVSAGLAALVRGAPVNRTAGGVLYIGLPTLALLWLRNTSEGAALVLWLFFVVWATDTCAYFAGRTIGGPRLAPSLSPKKTWAGLGGGMLGAALVGGAFTLGRGGAVLWAAAFAAALAVVAQLGDLFESWLKRRVDVKDSGDLIPGHGGLLDRVDGLLFAAPAFAAAVLLSAPVSSP
jgi:phosphatidate cytidylyltransferase